MAMVTIVIVDEDDDNVDIRFTSEPPVRLREGDEGVTNAQFLALKFLETVYSEGDVNSLKVDGEKRDI